MTVNPPTTSPPVKLKRAPSLVVVHTGDGKGKTSAAMGIALRSLARDWRVLIIQFVKSGSWHSGEEKSLRSLGADWHSMGDGFSWEVDDLDHSAELARHAWEFAKAAITGGTYQLVLLDEVTYPMNWEWIDEKDVVQTILNRPMSVNLVFTGRDAPNSLIEVADTVSEARNIKHAYDAGIRAAKGIDF